jgi:hypothetical protein
MVEMSEDLFVNFSVKMMLLIKYVMVAHKRWDDGMARWLGQRLGWPWSVIWNGYHWKVIWKVIWILGNQFTQQNRILNCNKKVGTRIRLFSLFDAISIQRESLFFERLTFPTRDLAQTFLLQSIFHSISGSLHFRFWWIAGRATGFRSEL